MLIFF